MKIIKNIPFGDKYKHIYINRQQAVFLGKILLVVMVLFSITECSTRKNTKITRAYHNVTAFYNVYFNGNESLKAGDLKLKHEYKEDYSKILPIFRYENPDAATLLESDMDRAIKKSAKTIKLHSITVKPKMKKKSLSREERAFMSKAEYCKWIDNAYLIMAKAHFYKRDYEAAKQMLFLVINKYKSKDTKPEAMLWLAKTYVQLKEYNSAENTLIDLRKTKKYDKKFKIQMNLVYASMFLKQEKYDEAAKKLRKVVALERNRKEKMRHLFILAQIYQYNDKYKRAEKYYKQVLKRNPNYEMTFIAKIRLAEIFERNGGDAFELKKQLLKMTKDEKNIDYLDQIYYALGKIELNEKNDEKAVEYFTLSSQAASSNGTQKVKTYIALAEYYYNIDDLKLSTAYYDSVFNAIEPKFPDYQKIYPEIENRHALTTHLYTVVQEDSLQRLAKMSDADRNRLINNIIQRIVKEEEKQKSEADRNRRGYDPVFDSNYGRRTNPMEGGKYYFYNPSTISFGMTEFKKKWGDRRLADNWRRSNKQVATEATDVENSKNAQIGGKPNQDSTKNGVEQRVTNVKSREYYLQNLPLTPEKLEASNMKIQEAMFEAAQLYEKKMNEPVKAIKQYKALLQRFPKTSYRKEVLYRLYTLYTKELDKVNADKYKSLIIKEFPETVYAKLLKDPEYAAKLMKNEKVAEKTYQTVVAQYQNKQYNECINTANGALKEHAHSDLVPRFIYLKGISYGEMGNHAELRKNLEIIIEKYPETEISKSARGIIDVLNTGKFKKDLYKLNKDTAHYFVMIFENSNIDKKKLSFDFKKFNLDKYTQEDLKVNIIEFKENKSMLIVRGLKNGTVAENYVKQINDVKVLDNYKQNISTYFVITPNNYQEFLKNKLVQKYLDFYAKHYNYQIDSKFTKPKDF